MTATVMSGIKKEMHGIDGLAVKGFPPTGCAKCKINIADRLMVSS